MLKKCFAFTLSLLLAVVCFGCTPGNTDTVSSDISGGLPDETADFTYFYNEMINNETTVVPVSAPDQCLYYYNRLKTDDTDLTWAYNEIVYAATHFTNPNSSNDNVIEVYFPQDLTDVQLAQAYEAVFFDHPELWYLRQPDKKGCTLHPENNRVAYLTFQEKISDIPTLNNDIEAAADAILLEAEKFTHRIDKIAYISAYIFENCIISWPTYETTQHSSAKEMLLEKHGVCVGFASTLTYLLQRGNIPAVTGHGKVSTGIEHCWTIVEHDGKYKYLDNYYMKEKGTGTEHGTFEFFCFESRDVFDSLYVTIAEGVLLPGTEIGANITAEPVPEDTTSSESDVSSEQTSEISE